MHINLKAQLIRVKPLPKVCNPTVQLFLTVSTYQLHLLNFFTFFASFQLLITGGDHIEKYQKFNKSTLDECALIELLAVYEAYCQTITACIAATE